MSDSEDHYSDLDETNDEIRRNVMPRLKIDLALKLIPEFNGDRTELHKFVSCCDLVARDMSTAADMPMLVNIIKSKLGGPAYHIIKYKQFNDWDTLRSILQNQYLERRTVGQIQTELVNVKQGSHESVRQFATKIEQLLMDLNDACVASEGEGNAATISNLNKKTALQAFTEGLNYQYKMIIKASRFRTLNEAIEAAIEEERMSAQNRKITNSLKPPFQSKPLKKCTYCNKNGHSYNECYSRQNQSLPNYPRRDFVKREPPPSPRVNIVRIPCAYCKKLGHHINDCYKKKFSDQKRASQNHFKGPAGNELGPSTSGGEVGRVQSRY